MPYDQNPITFLTQFGSGDRTKSLKASGHPTCFAANKKVLVETDEETEW